MPFFVLPMEGSSGRTAMSRPRSISDSGELLVPDGSGAKLPIEDEQISGYRRQLRRGVTDEQEK